MNTLRLRTLVIALHGKGSTAESSNTVQKLKAYLSENGMDVITPTYDTNASHEEIEEFMNQYINPYIEYATVAVIGISLGGYWAKYLANRLYGAKYIGLNPAINFYNRGVEKDKVGLPINIYVAKDDDVINPSLAIETYAKRGKVTILSEGGHRFLNGTLEGILPFIKQDIQRISL